MKTYGFGIVGCGTISDFHAAGIKDLAAEGRARLVAAAEPVEERRKTFAEKHGCDVAADYREMVRRKDVDVVCICTPSGAHLEPALAAIQAGKHVVVEKPIEVTLDRVDTLLRACDENRVRLCAIFPMRFAEHARAMKAAIAAGRFGRLTVGDCYCKWWRSQEYYDKGGWRGTWKLDGGGACMNQAIHGIDLIQWFMGPLDRIVAFSARLAHERIEVEDTAVAALRYKNGAMGVIECATSVHPGSDRKIEIHGDKGTAIMTDESILQWDFAEERPEDAGIREKFSPAKIVQKEKAASDPSAFSHKGHLEQLKDFLEALDNDREPFVGGREGRKAVEIITALYRSARTGKPVRLPLRPGLQSRWRGPEMRIADCGIQVVEGR